MRDDAAGEEVGEPGDVVQSGPATGSRKGWTIAVAILSVCVIGLGIALGLLYTRMVNNEELIRAQAVALQSQASRVESVSQEVQEIGPQPGPRGAKGERGPVGPPGPRGPRGYDGADGGFDDLIGYCGMPRVESVQIPYVTPLGDLSTRTYQLIGC